MIIIDKIKDPSPFFTYTPPPLFRTDYEKEKYWDGEKKIWHEGYSTDINGMCYYYGTQIWLKNRISGNIFRPEIRDVEVLVFSSLGEAIKHYQAQFILKGRGVGLSSIGGTLPFYFFRTKPGSNCIATSADKGKLADIFTDKTMVAYDHMHSDIQPVLIRKNETQRESYLKVGVAYKHEGNAMTAESKFTCKDTQKDDKAVSGFSGSGSIYGFGDEAPIMPRFDGFYNSAREVFTNHDQMRMEGLLLLGGTAEATMKPHEIQNLQKIWDTASSKNIRTLFIPATYGKFVVNGHSNHAKAHDEIMKKREEFKKAGDEDALRAYIKNNPLDENEIFDFAYSSKWEEEAMNQIKAQSNWLSKPDAREKINLQPRIIIVREEGIKCEPVTKSSLLILEHPQPNVKYMLGYDGVSTSELTSDSTEASNVACVVMKGVHPQNLYEFSPVGILTERPKSIQESNRKVLNLLKYYNQYDMAKINGELNAAGENMVQLVLDHGLGKCLVTRKNIEKKGNQKTKNYWFYRGDEIISAQYIFANIYFRSHAERVFFLSLLLDCQKKFEDNADILDAFLACLHGWGSGDILAEVKKIKRAMKVWRTQYVFENGRRVPKLEEVIMPG